MKLPAIEFILYAAFFRLAVVAAGLACVYMGYRLFVLGVMPREGSEIDARSGEIRLTLKNAAPGTCFAFFGAAIIAVMIAFGIPELSVSSSNAYENGSSGFDLRGDDETVAELVRQGQVLAEAGDHKGAIRAFAKALSDPTLPLNVASEPLIGLAETYHRGRRLDEAIAYARLVNQFAPENARALALIGRVERDRGNLEQALNAMKSAVALDSTLQPELAELEKVTR